MEKSSSTDLNFPHHPQSIDRILNPSELANRSFSEDYVCIRNFNNDSYLRWIYFHSLTSSENIPKLRGQRGWEFNNFPVNTLKDNAH